MFPEHQIIILEGFLKDHATLKTGVVKLKIQLCYFVKYIKTEKLFHEMNLTNPKLFKSNLMYYCRRLTKNGIREIDSYAFNGTKIEKL